MTAQDLIQEANIRKIIRERAIKSIRVIRREAAAEVEVEAQAQKAREIVAQRKMEIRMGRKVKAEEEVKANKQLE